MYRPWPHVTRALCAANGGMFVPLPEAPVTREDLLMLLARKARESGELPVRAMRLGRRGLGCELNPQYWRDGVRYCRETEAERATPTLFDLLGLNEAVPA